MKPRAAIQTAHEVYRVDHYVIDHIKELEKIVDVTGSGPRVVEKALNVLVTSILELDDHARAERVTIAYPDQQKPTPDLTPQPIQLAGEYVERVIGISLTAREMAQLLRHQGKRDEAARVAREALERNRQITDQRALLTAEQVASATYLAGQAP